MPASRKRSTNSADLASAICEDCARRGYGCGWCSELFPHLPRELNHTNYDFEKFEYRAQVKVRISSPRFCCKAYDAPPPLDPAGRYAGSLQMRLLQGEYFMFEELLYGPHFVSVRLQCGWWVNIWQSHSRQDPWMVRLFWRPGLTSYWRSFFCA